MIYYPKLFMRFDLDNEKDFVLVLDIGGTQFRLALANIRGEIIKRYAALIASPEDPHKGILQITEAAKLLVSEINTSNIRGLGIAIAGLVTPEKGVLLTSPNLLAWYGMPVKEIFGRELRLPVWVGNDANLAAMGERKFGAGKGIDDLVYITVSTGIGGGIVTGGKLLTGSRGFAGEIGHMTIDIDGPKCNCGNIGCLETLASGTAIARIAVERISGGESSSISDMVHGNKSLINAEVVFRAARDGDNMAADIVYTAATNLGVGIVNLVHLFNPVRVIIGGGVAKAGAQLFAPARQVVHDRVMRDIQVEIVPADLHDDPGLLGAVAMVLENS